jgi:FKBP12-rapamycin complex-associated protein
MTEMYKDVCDITLKLKDSRDALIKKTVVSVIPTLACYDPPVFSELYLHKSMSHLLNLLRKNNEKRDGKKLI